MKCWWGTCGKHRPSPTPAMFSTLASVLDVQAEKQGVRRCPWGVPKCLCAHVERQWVWKPHAFAPFPLFSSASPITPTLPLPNPNPSILSPPQPHLVHRDTLCSYEAYDMRSTWRKQMHQRRTLLASHLRSRGRNAPMGSLMSRSSMSSSLLSARANPSQHREGQHAGQAARESVQALMVSNLAARGSVQALMVSVMSSRGR